MVNLLLRMAQLARRPPSSRAVKIGLVAILGALAVAGIEALGLWPEAWTTTRARPPAVAAP